MLCLKNAFLSGLFSNWKKTQHVILLEPEFLQQSSALFPLPCSPSSLLVSFPTESQAWLSSLPHSRDGLFAMASMNLRTAPSFPEDKWTQALLCSQTISKQCQAQCGAMPLAALFRAQLGHWLPPWHIHSQGWESHTGGSLQAGR